MTRKLATIQKISALVPIKDADRIELAIINGWQVVTQKGQHKVGDLVVFYEIDSWLPASDPRYASFEERFINWNGKTGMRLKTIKLKKQLSQGLIMPVSAFPELSEPTRSGDSFLLYNEGDDVTEVLKIEKWENTESIPGEPNASKASVFPSFLRKTDQERIQNYGKLVERALDEEFEVTVKKDGSSLTVFRVDPRSKYYWQAVELTKGKPTLWSLVKKFFKNVLCGVELEAVYGICSRNNLLPLEGNSNFHKAAHRVLLALESEGEFSDVSYAVQGEMVAPNVQGNYEKVTEVEFHMFDLWNIDKQEYVLPWHRRLWATDNRIKHARVVDGGTLRDIIRYEEGDDIVKKLLTYASGPGDNEGVEREGVVFKSDSRDFSFKAVSNEYLLKTGK